MPDPEPKISHSTEDRGRTAAFLLLRLFLGLRSLLAGLDKFEADGAYSLSNYARNATHMAEGITGATFIPLWATGFFCQCLGFALVALGAALLLGIKARLALILSGLLYVALAFGLMAAQDNDGVGWLGVHVGLVAAALLLVRHNRFALCSDRHD